MICTVLDIMIASVPDGHVPVALLLGVNAYADLIAEPCPAITLNGETDPIHATYRRDYPEQLVWHRVWAGTWLWEVDRTALLTMRRMKERRGIHLYRGIPVERTAEVSYGIRSKPLLALVSCQQEATV